MFKLEHSIMIREHPKVVWAFLANLPVSQLCRRGRRSFQWLESPKPAVGVRYRLEARILGIGFGQEGKITRWEPPDSMAIALWEPKRPRFGLTYQLRYTITGSGSQHQGTILHATVIGSCGPKLIELVFKELYRRSLIDHLMLLKLAVEATDKDGQVSPAAQRIAEAPAVGG